MDLPMLIIFMVQIEPCEPSQTCHAQIVRERAKPQTNAAYPKAGLEKVRAPTPDRRCPSRPRRSRGHHRQVATHSDRSDPDATCLFPFDRHMAPDLCPVRRIQLVKRRASRCASLASSHCCSMAICMSTGLVRPPSSGNRPEERTVEAYASVSGSCRNARSSSFGRLISATM